MQAFETLPTPSARGLAYGVTALLAGLVFHSAAMAAASEERIEIPLENVFAPLHGYDDNDPIEVVLSGTLPDACFTLGDTFYEHDDDGTTIHLVQYAFRKRNDLCAEGAKLPPHLAMAVPFTNSVSIGTLPAADYALSFHSHGARTLRRALNIAPAATSLVDNLPYAVVNTMLVPSIVTAGHPLDVTLSGVLNSSCIELSEEVKQIHESDVVVLLPTVSVPPSDTFCAAVLRPFTKTVRLESLPQGKNLIHVRSMNGKSVNAVIQAE